MTTALCEVWKLRNANTASLKFLKHYKWKPKEANEISSNRLTFLKGKEKIFTLLLSCIYFNCFFHWEKKLIFTGKSC